MISNELVEAVVADARKTHTADFSRQGICFLGNLGRLSAMELRLSYLDLQHNAIKILDNLPPIITLERFDVSYNQLHQVTALLPFPRLKVFAARANAIQFVSSQFPACIEVIDLEGNQIESEGQIKSCLAARVLKLENNPIKRPQSGKPADASDLFQTERTVCQQGSARSVFQPARTLQSLVSGNQQLSKQPNLPQQSQQSFSQRQPAIKAYEELLQLYEKQLENQIRTGFPNPEKPQSLSVLRRAVFQLIYDKNAQKQENEALRQKLEQYEREIIQAGQKDRLMGEQTQELRDELLSASNENVQLHSELQAHFQAQQAAAGELQTAAAALRDFSALLAEQTQEALDSVEMLGRRVGRCQQAVRGFKMPQKQTNAKTVQTEAGVVSTGTTRPSQTEPPGLVAKAVQAEEAEKAAQATQATQTEEAVPEPQNYQNAPADRRIKANKGLQQGISQPAIEPPDCQERFPGLPAVQPGFQERTPPFDDKFAQPRRQTANQSSLVPLTDEFGLTPRQNPLLMSQEQYSQFANSIRRGEERLRDSDLESMSVLRIAQKYQQIDPPGADWRPDHQTAPDRPVQIKFFGVRPQSFVAQQLEQLGLEQLGLE